VDAGLPLLVVPAGPFNHFAADLGVESAEDALAALRRGDSVLVDVGTADGAAFLNTTSTGVYVDLVKARKRIEPVLGKWPAVLIALVHVLRTWPASSLRVASPGGDAVPLCLDGEATETKPAVSLIKRPRKLLVYRPATGDGPAEAPGTNQA
jgi:diacylglycerol kinase family enzyme